MACLRVRDLLPEFALDVLDPADAAEVERHLGDCAGCRKEAEEFREGAARLAFGLTEVTPPLDLGDRVVQGVAGLRTKAAEARSGRYPSRRTVRVIAAAGLAAAILAAGSFSWALAMRGQVQTVQNAANRRAQTVVKLERLLEAFQHASQIAAPNKPVHPVDASRFFGALLSSPAPGGGSGELLVFSISDSPDFVHMQVNFPLSTKGPFTVLFEQRTGDALSAGGLVKTPNGDYVLAKDPRFFDLDLSHLTGVVVLDKSGATLLTGSIQLLTAPSP